VLRIPLSGPSVNSNNAAAYIIPGHRAAHPFFPKVRPHAPNTIQTPSRDKLSFWGKVKHTIWEIGILLTERDTKYAIKAGMATAILSAPAFFDATRPTFVQYYGDWALISVRDVYFFLLSPTYSLVAVFYRHLPNHRRRK
jgi:hypothetical protein